MVSRVTTSIATQFNHDILNFYTVYLSLVRCAEYRKQEAGSRKQEAELPINVLAWGGLAKKLECWEG